MYKLMLFLWVPMVGATFYAPGFRQARFVSPQAELECGILRINVQMVRETIAVYRDLDLDRGLRTACQYYESLSREEMNIINILISHGANINQQDNTGNTVLHERWNFSSTRLVQYLLTIPNINPQIKNQKDDTVIDIAYKKINAGSLLSPQYLQSIHHVRKHILTKRAERLKEKSDLLAAVEKNDVNRAAYLMNKYPYFTKNYKDADGNTVLHVAIKTAGVSSDLVKHTIAVAPELIGAQNQYGKAPFHNPSVQRLCFRAITGTSQINEKSITV